MNRHIALQLNLRVNNNNQKKTKNNSLCKFNLTNLRNLNIFVKKRPWWVSNPQKLSKKSMSLNLRKQRDKKLQLFYVRGEKEVILTHRRDPYRKWITRHVPANLIAMEAWPITTITLGRAVLWSGHHKLKTKTRPRIFWRMYRKSTFKVSNYNKRKEVKHHLLWTEKIKKENRWVIRRVNCKRHFQRN